MSKNPCFRMYAEFLSDPKVQMMSEVMQRRLIMLFCLRCQNERLKEDEIAFALRISETELSETKSILVQKGIIDEKWNICKWEERQYLSDGSNERVKRYREKRYSMGLSANGYTKHSVTVTQRDCNRCVYCGETENLCIDHILPINQNGNDDIENLACSCKECNSGKSGRTPEQAGYSFKNLECEKRWKEWMSRRVTVTDTGVTVTVTVQDTDTDTDTDTERERGAKQKFPNKDYAFTGKSFKLTTKDFTTMKTTYHAIPDFKAELMALDGWYRENPGKYSFYHLGSLLNRKHQEMLIKNPPDIPWNMKPQNRMPSIAGG
jgi:5-methylcytosine-specific restriction endonuclease McrA